jgi:putative transposase
MGLSERTFLCHACGVMLDRDLNAAVNLAAYAESSPVKGRGADVRLGRSGSGQAVATKRQNTANVDNHRLSEIGVGS